ncbi:MAG: NUDIX hydrolase [Halobacteriaceae archaeon]
MSEWHVRESRVEYETGWYAGGYDEVDQPDGTAKRYYWAELAPAVVVVARDGEAVVVVEQYRPAIRRRCLELPAGIVEWTDRDAPAPDERRGHASGNDPGPTPAAYERAARRELREETGYAAGEVTHVEDVWCSTGVLRHRRGFVVARDLTPGDPDPDGNEFIDVRRVPVEEALATAREAPVNDATLEGLLLARADGYL